MVLLWFLLHIARLSNSTLSKKFACFANASQFALDYLTLCAQPDGSEEHLAQQNSVARAWTGFWSIILGPQPHCPTSIRFGPMDMSKMLFSPFILFFSYNSFLLFWTNI
jgi:hypothetical protein